MTTPAVSQAGVTLGHRASHLAVSGVFGTLFQKVHPAPAGVRAVFFSNNEVLRSEVESKGWEFSYVSNRQLELTPDYRTSSLQSKYVKFLQFLKDCPQLDRYEAITYFDHKFKVKTEHLQWIREHLESDKSVLIRNTPKDKTAIAHEIRAAMRQERYAARMPQTLAWIECMKAERSVVESVQIVNTGLIHYARRHRVLPMLDEIYTVVNSLGQPECQIVWAVLSQPYEREIQRVEWSQLCPEWKAP